MGHAEQGETTSTGWPVRQAPDVETQQRAKRWAKGTKQANQQAHRQGGRHTDEAKARQQDAASGMPPSAIGPDGRR